VIPATTTTPRHLWDFCDRASLDTGDLVGNNFQFGVQERLDALGWLP